MIHLLQAAGVTTDTIPTLHRMNDAAKNIASGDVQWDQILQQLVHWSLEAGRHILLAALLYFLGHYLIRLLNYLLTRFLERRKIEITVQTFVKSFVGILLQVLLIVSVISALGVNTTSFAALLASFGVAIGMALSGNLQNFAGGIVILFLKPYKVGDWLEAQGTAGTVIAIQIFHTILLTADGKQIYIPNGAMSSGTITNYTQTPTRRVEWVVAVEYGEDIDKVRQLIQQLIEGEARIFSTPAPTIMLKELSDNSVNILIRGWVNNADYWDVLFLMNEKIYKTFNEQGVNFPFPQLTVHQA